MMKNNLLILLRTNLQMMWGSMRYSKRKKKFIPLTAIVLLGGAAIIGVMALQAWGQTELFRMQGTPEMAIYYAVAQVMMIVLLLAFMRGGMSETTSDANFLLSLPIKKSTILLSKSISRYLFDLLPIAVFLLPSLVVYFVMVEFSLSLLLRGLLVMFMIPLCSVGLAYILSFLLVKISARLRRPEMMRTVLILIVTLLFTVLIMVFSGSMGAGGDLAEIAGLFPPLAWGAAYATYGGAGNLGLFALVAVLPFVVGVWLQARVYGVKQTGWRAKNRELVFRQHSPLRALFGKEIRQYFSISIYVINTIIGPLFAIVIAVLVVAARGQILGFLQSEPEFAVLGDMLPIVLMTMLLFFTGLTLITASSISLEGKNIRILRAAPIAERDIFASKILVHLVVAMPSFVLCTATVGVAMGYGAAATVLMTLCMAAATLLTAVWGLYVNLLLPKLNWDNETVVVKQSAACAVAIFTGFVIDAIPILLFFAIGRNLLPALGLSVLLMLALTALVWALTLTDGKKRYREL